MANPVESVNESLSVGAHAKGSAMVALQAVVLALLPPPPPQPIKAVDNRMPKTVDVVRMQISLSCGNACRRR